MPKMSTQAWLTWRQENSRKNMGEISHGEVVMENNWREGCQELLSLSQPSMLRSEGSRKQRHRSFA
jgi:hypothetical protein